MRGRIVWGGMWAMLLLAASVSASPPKKLEILAGKTVMLVRRPTPDFLYLTSGSAFAGAVSATGPFHHNAGPRKTASAAGAAVLADAHIEDPATSLGDTLFADLVSTYGMTASPDGPMTVANGNVLDNLVVQRRSDYIFEFYTDAWRTFYFLFDSTHLDVWYYAKARLIDTKTGWTIRQESCAHRPRLTPTTPTVDELLANHGVKLREALESMQTLCLATVREAFALSATEGGHQAAPVEVQASDRKGAGAGAATVRVCIDAQGVLTGPPIIVESSGSDSLDAVAVKVAQSASGRYKPAIENGQPAGKCFSFRVRVNNSAPNAPNLPEAPAAPPPG